MLRDLPPQDYWEDWILPILLRAPPWSRLLLSPTIYAPAETAEAIRTLGHAIYAGFFDGSLIAATCLEEAKLLFEIQKTKNYNPERCYPCLHQIAAAERLRQRALAMAEAEARAEQSDFDEDPLVRALPLARPTQAKALLENLRHRILLAAGQFHQHTAIEPHLRQFFKLVGMLEGTPGAKGSNVKTMSRHGSALAKPDEIVRLILAVALDAVTLDTAAFNRPKLLSFKPFGEDECKMLLKYSYALRPPSKRLLLV